MSYGDSDGELRRTAVSNIWGMIQNGLFVQDIGTANRFFKKKTGIKEWQEELMGGICDWVASNFSN